MMIHLFLSEWEVVLNSLLELLRVVHDVGSTPKEDYFLRLKVKTISMCRSYWPTEFIVALLWVSFFAVIPNIHLLSSL